MNRQHVTYTQGYTDTRTCKQDVTRNPSESAAALCIRLIGVNGEITCSRFAPHSRLRDFPITVSIKSINTKNCSLSIVFTATGQKPQKSLKRWYYPPSHCLIVNVMLSNMTFLMIFAVFWSVAVNTMDKLQFLVLIFAVLLSKLCNVLLCNYTVSLNSFSIR